MKPRRISQDTRQVKLATNQYYFFSRGKKETVLLQETEPITSRTMNFLSSKLNKYISDFLLKAREGFINL